MNRDAFFSELPEYKRYGLLFYSLALAIIYFFLPGPFVIGTVGLCLFLSFRFLPDICLSIYLIASVYLSFLASGAVSIIFVFLSLAGWVVYRKKSDFRTADYLMLFVVVDVVAISVLTGFEPDRNTAIQMVLCIVLYVILRNSLDSDGCACLAWAYLCAGIGICFFILMRAVLGGNLLIYGRISFEGNIKNVSMLCVPPLLLLTSSFFQAKDLFKGRHDPVKCFLLLLMFSAVIILTAARGMIIASVIAVLIQVFFGSERAKSWKRFFPVLVIVIVFIIMMFDNETFRISRLFITEELVDGNGRLGIWQYYIGRMAELNPMSFLFGVGPGMISRIGTTGYYSHSIFMDVLFSFGVVGELLIFVFFAATLRKVLKSKNICLISIFIAELIIALSHGTASDLSVYILLAWLVSAAKPLADTEHQKEILKG